jgi:hypothetical protein
MVTCYKKEQVMSEKNARIQAEALIIGSHHGGMAPMSPIEQNDSPVSCH